MAATSRAVLKMRAEASRSPPADQTSRHTTRLNELPQCSGDSADLTLPWVGF
jgi:hypothetical protein